MISIHGKTMSICRKLRITRKRQLVAGGCPYHVLIDGNDIGIIENNHNSESNIDCFEHTIQFIAEINGTIERSQITIIPANQNNYHVTTYTKKNFLNSIAVEIERY